MKKKLSKRNIEDRIICERYKLCSNYKFPNGCKYNDFTTLLEHIKTFDLNQMAIFLHSWQEEDLSNSRLKLCGCISNHITE